MSLIWNYIQIS